MSLLSDFKNAESLVRKVMKEYPEARADDRKLLAIVWAIQGFKMTPAQYNVFTKVLPAETITRARRKLHERGIYMPIKEVYEQRTLLDFNFGRKMKHE